MKHLAFAIIFLISFGQLMGQGGIPTGFFDGKSVVMVSSDPGSRPVLDWKALADSVHVHLVEAGADPVAYFELEQVALSEARQADFAKALAQRKVTSVILVTRKKESLSIHVGPFSGDGKIISTTALFGVSGKDWDEAGALLVSAAKGSRSKNLLVIDVAEFPVISASETAQSVQKFLPRNPLNLEVFKTFQVWNHPFPGVLSPGVGERTRPRSTRIPRRADQREDRGVAAKSWKCRPTAF